MKFALKALAIPIIVGISVAILVEVAGLATGNPDALPELLTKTAQLLDKLIELADRCAEECFND